MPPDILRLGANERPSGKGPQIYTPEAFDQLIAEQPSVKGRIAGFSTVSVSHVMRGLAQPEFSIPTWSNQTAGAEYVRVALNEPLQRKVFQREPEGEYAFPSFMYNNRAYAPLWTMGEIYHDIEPNKTFDDVIDYLEPVILHSPLLIPATERQTIRSLDELINVTAFPEPDDMGLIASYRTSLSILSRLGFSRTENFFRFLNEIPQRKGVQIIYGPPEEFVRFLEQKEHPFDIDMIGNDYEGLTIFSSIPGELVMGLIPLGAYERRVLLGEK